MAIHPDNLSSFTSIFGFGNHLVTMLVLVLSAGISSYIRYGYGTRKAREMFISLILVIIVGVQFYHLVFAAINIPANKYMVYNTDFHRSDCQASGKGGKRSFSSDLPWDYNLCFCHTGAICTDKITGDVLPTETCPTDGSAWCTNANGDGVNRYVNDLRNCIGGQAAFCTKDQPCDPCEYDTIENWGDSGRCRTCSTQFKGELSMYLFMNLIMNLNMNYLCIYLFIYYLFIVFYALSNLLSIC
jgi:hypothetical protein